MKGLIYITKDKPYLFDLFDLVDFYPGIYGSLYVTSNLKHFKDEDYTLNGKIVAEFELEAEEITRVRNYYDMKPESFDNLYYTKTLDCEQLSVFSCMTTAQFDDYLKDKTGYAIHIKNLKIFDKPKELSDYHISYYNKDLKMMREKHLEKAPQNMCRAFDVNGNYIVLSVHPESACGILNGTKTVDVRKLVLNCMK